MNIVVLVLINDQWVEVARRRESNFPIRISYGMVHGYEYMILPLYKEREKDQIPLNPASPFRQSWNYIKYFGMHLVILYYKS